MSGAGWLRTEKEVGWMDPEGEGTRVVAALGIREYGTTLLNFRVGLNI